MHFSNDYKLVAVKYDVENIKTVFTLITPTLRFLINFTYYIKSAYHIYTTELVL